MKIYTRVLLIFASLLTNSAFAQVSATDVRKVKCTFSETQSRDYAHTRYQRIEIDVQEEPKATEIESILAPDTKFYVFAGYLKRDSVKIIQITGGSIDQVLHEGAAVKSESVSNASIFPDDQGRFGKGEMSFRYLTSEESEVSIYCRLL